MSAPNVRGCLDALGFTSGDLDQDVRDALAELAQWRAFREHAKAAGLVRVQLEEDSPPPSSSTDRSPP